MEDSLFDTLEKSSEKHSKEQYRDNSDRGQELKKELKQLSAGKGENDNGEKLSKQYEELITKIVNYLFGTDLGPPKIQLSTKDNLHRFDMIARINHDCSSFWKFVAESLGSKYVVIECKNYADKITQGEILTTEKYLFNKALRKFALIFTREGADKPANNMIDGILREEGKVLLVLDDNDVIKLLEDPIGKDEYLLSKLDNLFMKLSR